MFDKILMAVAISVAAVFFGIAWVVTESWSRFTAPSHQDAFID